MHAAMGEGTPIRELDRRRTALPGDRGDRATTATFTVLVALLLLFKRHALARRARRLR